MEVVDNLWLAAKWFPVAIGIFVFLRVLYYVLFDAHAVARKKSKHHDTLHEEELEHGTIPLDLQGRLSVLSGVELAQLVREGAVTSAQLVDFYIDKMRRVNPDINAVAKYRFEEARQEAKKADKLLQEHKRNKKIHIGVYHGVPCTIKECFSVKGMPYTAGLVSRKNKIADEDCILVKRLKAEGAIVIGVTNTSELCMWMESNNKVYGRTKNPYHFGHISGGSSGGEGSIIGSGASPFGLGSDIGGSIRMPAFFNGVFGHKATPGLIPSEGQFPCSHGSALKMLTSGPLCRSAEDIWPLLKIFAGPDPDNKNPSPYGANQDAYNHFITLDPYSVKLTDIYVLSVQELGGFLTAGVSSELKSIQRDVANYLQEEGAIVEGVRTLHGFSEALQLWSSLLQSAGGPSFSDLMADGKEFSVIRESFKTIFGLHTDFTAPGLGLCLIESVTGRLPKSLQQSRVTIAKSLQKEVAERIGQNGVLLFPSYPTVAPKHYTPILRPTNWCYTALFNALELPVTQVPLGISDYNGLPLGIQVAAAPGNDHLTVAVALALEKAFGGWVPPGHE